MREVAMSARASAASFGTCFEDHRARVYRWAWALTRNHHDALDIAQSVFLRLIEHGGPLQPESVLRAWLRRVTHNLAVDRWRRAGRPDARAGLRPASAHSNDPPAPGPAPDDRAESGEQAAAIRAALAGLSDPQRLVLLARACDELPFSQIAAELEISASTAKTHYARALEALRSQPQLQRLAGRNEP
jgi:RNA polymerase sigma-70 factor (ECF subfamily)